ncbi:hypothetical protein ACCM60_03940 [Pseudomonas chlororaphis subsp. aureofaciens]|uniref:hypothetical protein n=1 Tax=Pseudomonas chlororaphis TaxID=587753 RepID=UPI0018EA2D0F|nr:hypothetical protein [Pseudomonas chlororaphis]
MGGRTPGSGSQSASTPESLPSSQPTNFSSHDHSFTLQMIMELQKSSGAIETQLKALRDQLNKIEDRHSKADEKTDSKIDKLDDSLRGVQNKISVLSKVAVILFAAAVMVGGVAWTVTQDAFKDITKSAINSALAGSVKASPALTSQSPASGQAK